jgi:hypothetical protein
MRLDRWSTEVHWFQASLAHEWRTMATLLVLSGDNSYTGWTAAERAPRKPKPGDFSVHLPGSFVLKKGSKTRA